MKKNKILALVMLTAIFVSAFSIATVTISPASFVFAKEAPSVINEPVFHPDKLSYDNGTWAQLTSATIVLDGTVSEWDTAGIIPEYFGGALVYLAYDATSVYVAVVWADAIVSSDVSYWNKTDTADGFEMLAGDDDVVTVGFDDGTDSDFWTWTASNRTSDIYAYETNSTGFADAGALPYVMNTNSTNFAPPSAPFWDETWTPIVDYTTIPVNQLIQGWDLDENTPLLSQTDVDIGVNHTGTHYIVEFERTLVAPNVDDMALDFTNNDIDFYIGVANGDDAMDMEIATSSYLIFDDNTAAELTFDAIPSLVTESLLLQGTAFDDYGAFYVDVWVDTWADTWGSVDYVTVNLITGDWSYLLLFNEMDMPLGDANVWITLHAPYETDIALNWTSNFDDIEAPAITGIVDLADRYPTGVPADEEYVTVTVGLSDDYDDVNYLTANLYSYVDDGIALATPMTQFYVDSSTFSANITIDPTADYSFRHNYTYFIQAWDTSNNKVRSADFTFYTAITIVTPGFGIIAGVFGLAIAVLFVKKLKK